MVINSKTVMFWISFLLILFIVYHFLLNLYQCPIVLKMLYFLMNLLVLRDSLFKIL